LEVSYDLTESLNKHSLYCVDDHNLNSGMFTLYLSLCKETLW